MITSKNRKHGFTIVELVIVIAVIAILAAVLIPTFSHLVNEANLSADQVAVKNMNTALKIYEADKGKPTDLYSLNTALESCGYNSSSTPVTKGYSFKWNRADNVMVLVDESNKIVYPEKYENETYDQLKYFDLSYPVAQVEEYGKTTVDLGGNQTLDLDCSFAFIGDFEDAATSEYKDWAVDFVVYFDEDLKVTAAGQTGLAGQYDTNSTNWVALDIFYLNDLNNVDTPVTIQAGTKYNLLQDIVIGKLYTNYQGMENILWDYEGICSSVGTFNCGAYDDGTNAGTTMTVELRMYETITTNEGNTSTTTRIEDNYIVVYVYEYTFQ